MSRLERYFWNTLVVCIPWAVYFAIAAVWGAPTADRGGWLYALAMLGAMFVASISVVAMPMARAVRAPLLSFRLWTNRQWRSTLGVRPEPEMGDPVGWRDWLRTVRAAHGIATSNRAA